MCCSLNFQLLQNRQSRIRTLSSCTPTFKLHKRFLFRSPLCDAPSFYWSLQLPGVFLNTPPLSSSQNWDLTGHQRDITRSHARPGISPSRLYSIAGEKSDSLDVSFLRTASYCSLTPCLPRSRKNMHHVLLILHSSLYCVS